MKVKLITYAGQPVAAVDVPDGTPPPDGIQHRGRFFFPISCENEIMPLYREGVLYDASAAQPGC